MQRRSALLLASVGSWSPFGPPDRITHGEAGKKRGDVGAAPPGLFSRASQHRQSHYHTSSSSAAAASPSSSSSSSSSSNTRGSGTAANKSRNAGESSAQAIHMYASKENAWHGYTDDRYYGAKRFKEYWQRMLSDRGIRYYIFGVLVVMLGASAKLWQMQNAQRSTEGLLGPKKKNYRSRLTVVLDVDETLLSYGDKAFRLKAGLVPRPYLVELLDYLTSIDAEVVLWSACSERYMRQVLGVIDPSGHRVSQYITRSSDWFTRDHYYEKNLWWLKRPMDDTIMIENRALSGRNCNANVLLVDDFIRGEYMDSGQDHPANDHALRTVKEIIKEIEESGRAVPDYLQDVNGRNREIKEIPCHLAIRQLPDEIARGVFFFIGDKYKMKAKKE